VGFLGAAMLGVLLAERALRRQGPTDGTALSARQWTQLGLAVLTVAALASLYPLNVSRRNVAPRYPAILAYLREQPKSALVASLSAVANNIPSFSRRRVLVASEYAIPIDRGYITRYRARAHALIEALYTPDPSALAAFLQRYRVSHLIVDPTTLSAEGLKTVWWRREHAAAHARVAAALARGETPALLGVMAPCAALREKTLVVIDARCVLERAGR